MHTFTVIRQNHAKPFKDELPYVVAIVELEEGPRMMGNVTASTPTTCRSARRSTCTSFKLTKALPFRFGVRVVDIAVAAVSALASSCSLTVRPM